MPCLNLADSDRALVRYFEQYCFDTSDPLPDFNDPYLTTLTADYNNTTKVVTLSKSGAEATADAIVSLLNNVKKIKFDNFTNTENNSERTVVSFAKVDAGGANYSVQITVHEGTGVTESRPHWISSIAVIIPAAPDNNIIYAEANGAFNFWSAGWTITTSGFANAANNGTFTIQSVGNYGGYTINALYLTSTLVAEGPVSPTITTGVSITADVKEIRLTGESLAGITSTTESEEVRSDRQLSTIIRTSISAEGDINGELSYGTYDDFFEGVFESDGWADAGVTINLSGELSVTANTSGVYNYYVILSTDPTLTDALSVGQYIKVTGFVNVTNNGLFKILYKSVTEPMLGQYETILRIALSGFVNENATGLPVTMQPASYIVNGITEHYYFIEKEFTDVFDEAGVMRYKGMAPTTCSITVPQDDKITLSFSFIGTKEVSATDRLPNAIASTTTYVMASGDNVTLCGENDEEVQLVSFSCEINNNLRHRKAIGTVETIDIGHGRLSVTGKIQAYFANSDLIDRYRNYEKTDLSIHFMDSEGNKYFLDIPAVRYTVGAQQASSANSDVIVDLDFTAIRDTSEDVMIRLVRFPAI